jgi:hypothetical protein
MSSFFGNVGAIARQKGRNISSSLNFMPVIRAKFDQATRGIQIAADKARTEERRQLQRAINDRLDGDMSLTMKGLKKAFMENKDDYDNSINIGGMDLRTAIRYAYTLFYTNMQRNTNGIPTLPDSAMKMYLISLLTTDLDDKKIQSMNKDPEYILGDFTEDEVKAYLVHYRDRGENTNLYTGPHTVVPTISRPTVSNPGAPSYSAYGTSALAQGYGPGTAFVPGGQGSGSFYPSAAEQAAKSTASTASGLGTTLVSMFGRRGGKRKGTRKQRKSRKQRKGRKGTRR